MMALGKDMALDLGTWDDEEESYRLIVRDAADRENFERELAEMIEALKRFPCICVWVLFNESWGQFDSTRLTEVIRALDPTRPGRCQQRLDRSGQPAISVPITLMRPPLLCRRRRG